MRNDVLNYAHNWSGKDCGRGESPPSRPFAKRMWRSIGWAGELAACLIVALSGLSGAFAASQSGANDLRFHVQHWTTEHGLPDNGVKAIAQTRDGYLWIGTFNGLARFDGVTFTTFTRGNTPGLVSDAIKPRQPVECADP